jgi:hypothetical protein
MPSFDSLFNAFVTILVTEVDACLEQLAHGKIWQCHCGGILYRLSRHETVQSFGPPEGPSERACFVCELRRKSRRERGSRGKAGPMQVEPRVELSAPDARPRDVSRRDR